VATGTMKRFNPFSGLPALRICFPLCPPAAMSNIGPIASRPSLQRNICALKSVSFSNPTSLDWSISSESCGLLPMRRTFKAAQTVLAQ
jgi:hypothetical protein